MKGTSLYASASPTMEDTQGGDYIREQIKGTRGPVYSEQPIYLLLEGREVEFQPFIMTELARQGKWDPSPFLKMIRDQRYGLLVLGEDVGVEQTDYLRYTPEMAEAIRTHYRRGARIPLPGVRAMAYTWLPR